MPEIPKETMQKFLHSYLTNLAANFARAQWFTIEDLYTCGKLQRYFVGYQTHLPEKNAIDMLVELAKKDWIETKLEGGKFKFSITNNYEGLPDAITPMDIYKEKMSLLSNLTAHFYKDALDKLISVERKLLVATNDSDFSEIGNLCVQFWEDFTDDLWEKHCTENKPAKKQIKDKLSPIIKKIYKNSQDTKLADAVFSLFDQLRDRNEKLKHRNDKDFNKELSMRSAKNLLLLTVFIAEDIVFNLLNHVPIEK